MTLSQIHLEKQSWQTNFIFKIEKGPIKDTTGGSSFLETPI